LSFEDETVADSRSKLKRGIDPTATSSSNKPPQSKYISSSSLSEPLSSPSSSSFYTELVDTDYHQTEEGKTKYDFISIQIYG